ncbi:hypothetical protein AHFPHNDE_03128 [Pseudomonas sp. MM227]|uniref:hypothetical protein n=1 Tax=Pseudomonas sp. MM227 TaxID=3019968 RepID=UPI002220CF9D|nr:hypothetical protein [Pseudomonas sp. MM227]CAI3789432.1 hypothetical protein AHFPHNDE_03128 [Pseudomonas sp. MM227]
MSIPATIAHDLIAELDAVNDADANQFQIGLLLRKADRLLTTDAFSGYVIKGILYSYLWDEKNTRIFFAKAEAISTSNIFLYMNQAVVLGRLSYDSESRQSYLKAVQISRVSEEAAYQYLLSCIGSNRPDLIADGLDLYVTAGGKMSNRISTTVHSAQKCKAMFESAEIDFSFAETMHALVGKVVRAFKVRDRGLGHTLIGEDGLCYLSVYVSVQATVDIVVQMNEQLTAEILSVYDFSCEQADKLIYHFVPLSDDEVEEKAVVSLASVGESI